MKSSVTQPAELVEGARTIELARAEGACELDPAQIGAAV
jgi:hypothetical protein